MHTDIIRSRNMFLLLGLALAAFGASVAGSFHFDDYSLFARDLWHPWPTRPLTFLTFWLNRIASGQDPWPYHVVNLGLHLASVWLAYRVFVRLLDGEAAWLATAIFAVHPFQAEPVNYIFARSSLLTTMFCLAALHEWILDRPWRATACFGLALLAKEECATFPLFLVLLDVWQRGRVRNFKAIGGMLFLAAAGVIRVAAASQSIVGSGAGLQAGITPQAYLLTQGTVILRYLRLLVLPWGFTVDPDIAVPNLAVGLLAWAAILATAAIAILAFRKTKPAFWFLGGLILLLPTSSFFPAADLAADRRLYLPLVAWAPCAALLLLELPLHKLPRAWTMAIAALFILALTTLSLERTLIWRTEESLWADALDKAPQKVRPRIQLARAVDPGRALQVLQEAESIAPNDASVPSEQGRILLQMGRPERALVAFGRALALDPGSATGLNNRAVALQQMGQSDAARQDFERALSKDPCLFDARWNLLRLGMVAPPAGDCNWTAEQRHALDNGATGR
jgi:protein O-mannosyl-transferase